MVQELKAEQLTLKQLQQRKLVQSTIKLEDYMDSLQFWNQFTVEVDDTNISDASKLHYLLGLVTVYSQASRLQRSDGV